MKKAVIVLCTLSALVIVGILVFTPNSSDGEFDFDPAPTNLLLRTTESGDVIGFIGHHSARTWLGIPYAEPPVGTLRWRAPRSPLLHNEPLEATDTSSPCPQYQSILSGLSANIGSDTVVGSEDCLYLNIWSSAGNFSAPVMVWLHGGGNSAGTGGTYIGARLATTHNLVIVTVNYRLGLLGWFHHPALKTGDHLDDSGNFGTLDIVRALQWVRDNIEQFGGDPDNVTIFGESAGGLNVLSLMASPYATGLFHRAIVQSGSFRETSMSRAYDDIAQGGHQNSSTELLKRLIVHERLAPDLESAKSVLSSWDSAMTARFLYAQSSGDLYRPVAPVGMGMVDVPNVFQDGTVIPDKNANELFSDLSEYNAVPVVLGTNRDEPSLFMAQDPRFVDSYFGLINRLKDESDYRKRVYYGGKLWRVSGVDVIANSLVAGGNADVFAYRFDWDEEPSVLGFDLSVALGAAHGIEIPFVFGSFEHAMGNIQLYPNDLGQMSLAFTMMSYWAEFAYSGDPGRGRIGTSTPWTRWNVNGDSTLLLDNPRDSSIHMEPLFESFDSIQEEFVADEGFPDLQAKCAAYTEVFGYSDQVDENVLKRIGCAES